VDDDVPDRADEYAPGVVVVAAAAEAAAVAAVVVPVPPTTTSRALVVPGPRSTHVSEGPTPGAGGRTRASTCTAGDEEEEGDDIWERTASGDFGSLRARDQIWK
jgi:hypothetical protein